MAKLIFTKRPHRPGSTMQEWEASSERGYPRGIIWTWPNTKTEWHPFHAKPLHGEHRTFPKLEGAKEYLERHYA